MSSIRRVCARVCALALIVYGFWGPVQHVSAKKPLTTHNRPAYWQSTSSTLVHRPRVRPKPTDPQLCLAQVLFFEANNESVMGLEAVAATVFNRMTLPHYPHTVCGVVYQAHQYSWTENTANWARQPPQQFFALARNFIGMHAQLAQLYPVTHFHHEAIHPHWSSSLDFYGQYGAHQFYRVTDNN